jgi:hypothetical protein
MHTALTECSYSLLNVNNVIRFDVPIGELSSYSRAKSWATGFDSQQGK